LEVLYGQDREKVSCANAGGLGTSIIYTKKTKQINLNHIHRLGHHIHYPTLISPDQPLETCQFTPAHVGGVRENL
jgi:hypothetical protein